MNGMARSAIAACAMLILFLLAGERAAGETIDMARPLDIPTERLERPRPEQERSLRSRAALEPAAVVKWAKQRAKKELGPAFDDYELKAVVFDPTTRLWSVTFDPKRHRGATAACLIVFVQDDTHDTEVGRCG